MATETKKGIFLRGPVGILVIVAHVVIIYFVAASLGIVELPNLAKPMEAVIIDSPAQEKSEPVKVIKPDLEQPQIETPPLEDTVPEIEVPTDEPAPAAITAEHSSAQPVGETANMQVANRVDPVYPPDAGLTEGTVVLRLLIGKTGTVDDVTVVRAAPRGVFERAAVAAFAAARFAPGRLLGLPVKSQVTFEVRIYCPRNMTCEVLMPAPVGVVQEEAAVDDDPLWIAQMVCQPAGADNGSERQP